MKTLTLSSDGPDRSVSVRYEDDASFEEVAAVLVRIFMREFSIKTAAEIEIEALVARGLRE